MMVIAKVMRERMKNWKKISRMRTDIITVQQAFLTFSIEIQYHHYLKMKAVECNIFFYDRSEYNENI